MYYTPSDSRERHAFIDQSVNNTLEALRIPDIAKRLGTAAAHFSDVASSLVVANINDGEVQFPKRAEDGSLPIIAMRPDERLVMAPGYSVQDDAQAESTIRLFESWRPRYQTAYELFKHYAGVISLSDRRPPVASMHDITVAMTGHEASLIPEDRLKSLFSQGPERGIAIVKKRPCLMLKLDPSQKGAAADVIVHELAHVDSAQESPVTVVHSQKSADMAALRVELRAYQAGSIVAGYRYHKLMQKRGGNLAPEDVDSSIVQVLVEAARKSMEDPLDPYRPSPHLLKKLESVHAGTILHGNVNYEEMLAMFDQSRAS